MKSLKISFVFFLLVSLFFPAILVSQTFENFDKSVLIDIPGDNYDFDLPADGIMYPIDESYITWVNTSGSVYTIYVKRLTPESNDTNIVIASDNTIKSNPQIAMNSSGPGITIFWQNYSDGFYQIVRRDFADGSLSNEVIFRDSLSSDPQITSSYNHLAWIMNDSLYAKVLFPDTTGIIYVDGPDCSSPSFNSNGWCWGDNNLIYEKLVEGDRHIFIAEYYSHYLLWNPIEVSDGDNRNPAFGLSCGFAFESNEDGISRIKYTDYFENPPNYFTTENTTCNYKNPDILSYLIPTNRPDEDTPFFITFDTDSLENNNEILVKTFYWGIHDTLINLSDMAGNDFKPRIDVINIGIDYLIIVWEHQEGSNSTIWMAKTIFHPAGGVKDDDIDLGSFELLQNYPNPFNPTTSIEYSLKQGADVKVTVYDILGNRITVLVYGYEYAGSHKIVFDGKNLSSGIYFYSIEVNSLQKTKSMVLLR